MKRLWLALALALACDQTDAALGRPCNEANPCPEELICDEHDGQASCQVPHSHGSSDGSTGEAALSSSTTNTETASQTDDAAGSTSGSSDASGSSGLSSDCERLCECLAAECRDMAGYPFADPQTCLQVCEEEFAPATVPCFESFCLDVPYAGPGAEHACQHAWGALGSLEC